MVWICVDGLVRMHVDAGGRVIESIDRVTVGVPKVGVAAVGAGTRHTRAYDRAARVVPPPADALYPPPHTTHTLSTHKHTQDGTYYGLASVDNLNLQPNEVARTVTVDAERLDAVVKVTRIHTHHHLAKATLRCAVCCAAHTPPPPPPDPVLCRLPCLG